MAKSKTTKNTKLNNINTTIEVNDDYSVGDYSDVVQTSKATKKTRPNNINTTIEVNDGYSAGDYSQGYESTRAYADEELHEEVVILDNLNKLLDKINKFDPSLVQSYSPVKKAEKIYYVTEIKDMVKDAIEYWDGKHFNGKNVVAKGIEHYSAEVFEAVERIMYLCYDMVGGKTVEYDPSQDLNTLENALYYNENYYEEQIKMPVSGKVAEYKSSQDLNTLENVLYYNENYEEQLEIPIEDYEDIPF